MKIDVILPTYNRADLLPRALDSTVNAADPEGHEVQIVIVDNNSSDHTKALAERYVTGYGTKFTYLFEPKQGFPRTCARLRSQGRWQPWRPPLLRL
jgi:glucosyl-dolichyl phosphate glucuronosyltransferase